MKLDFALSDADFLKCAPRESKPYSEVWSEDLRDSVFSRGASGDLRECRVDKCAFNFLPEELAIFEKLKTDDEREKMFIQFYTNRVQGKVGLDAERTPDFIRSKTRAFDDCQSKEFDRLLDARPLKGIPYRLSHILYNPKMRQTTRLLQGVSYPLSGNRKGICYAEALIFSDHYDLDRVEVWKLERTRAKNEEKSEVQLTVRHRVDLLNTWFRRLSKGSLRDEIRDVLAKQMREFKECLVR